MSEAVPDRAPTRAASAPDAVVPDAAAVAPETADAVVSAAAVSAAAVPESQLDAATAIFGDHLPLATRYAELLITAGVERGLIGPREASRVWDRHLLNCGSLAELIPYGAYVIDVGSGAGLPGIVLAVARPDLRLLLIDSLVRRTVFLGEAVATLELTNVEVVRARAEECVDSVPRADVVTARAVAPLDRLTAWCLPLAKVGGVMLAFKGVSAGEEIAEHRPAVNRLGGSDPVVRTCGADHLDPAVTVVEVRRLVAGGAGGRPGGGSGGRAGGGSAGRAGTQSGGRSDWPSGARSGRPSGARSDGRSGGRSGGRPDARRREWPVGWPEAPDSRSEPDRRDDETES